MPTPETPIIQEEIVAAPVEISPEPICLEYLILEHKDNTIVVEFKHPNWLGMFSTDEYEEEIDGELVTQTRTIDLDPNKHITKTIKVPVGEDGLVDRDALRQILVDQARGVKTRMTVFSPVPTTGDLDLDNLVGATL